MTPGDQNSAAQDLLDAEKQRAQISLLFLQYPEMKIKYAYAIQNKNL